MQLIDKNGVFKDWNTLKYENDKQNNLYFQQMQLVHAMPSNWENNMNINKNTFTIADQYFNQSSIKN